MILCSIDDLPADDLEAYRKAVEEYEKNPSTYSHAEVVRILENEEVK